MQTARSTNLRISSTWDGRPIPESEHATVALVLGDDALSVRIDAPYADDPPPPGPPRSTEGLWDYEVVELFLLGRDDRYLEIELSPHGHWLVLELAGQRRVERQGHPLQVACTIAAGRWQAQATIPGRWLPPGLSRANAYAIRGLGEARGYFAAFGLGGEVPDFHRLDDFAPLDWSRG